MSKHTPGPWKFEDGYIVEVNPEPNSLRGPIASVGAMPWPSETQANIDLFIAAPRMKAAIEGLVEFWDTPRIADQLDCIEQELRAALAEANGEEAP